MIRFFGISRRLLHTTPAFRTVTRQDPYNHMEVYGSLHHPLTLRFDYVDKSPDVMSLIEKAKGPWTSLTIEEKHRLYRGMFPFSFADIQADGGKTLYVCTGSLIIILVGIGLFFVSQNIMNRYKEPIRTRNPEWEAAAIEKNRENLTNPVFGMSSKKYK